jgi:PIN domain nuclease of toxin-antitoxin system
MKLLLDTHALLWWLNDDPSLGSKARSVIGDDANHVCISIVSLWEMAIKVRIGKLQSDLEKIFSAVSAQGIRIIDIRPSHLSVLTRLPRHHKDPFDLMMVAQAMVEGATLMTSNRNITLYPGVFIRCSD